MASSQTDGQVPCPRADCSTTLSRLSDIPRHIKDKHDVERWYCPHLGCSYRGSKRRSNVVGHIIDKHSNEGQVAATGSSMQEPIREELSNTHLEAIQANPVLTSSNHRVQYSMSTPSDSPLIEMTPATSIDGARPNSNTPSMKYGAINGPLAPSSTLYSTYPNQGLIHPPMTFHSNQLAIEEASQHSLVPQTLPTLPEEHFSGLNATNTTLGIEDSEYGNRGALQNWDHFDPSYHSADENDWKSDYEQK